ncbi:uncharacterized protein LOC132627040 [Lycium barbarum]|uniref:uncharacterized protein LOC132627040 n=1 Tax=Lycium barbarum TaxID=112863 RepID=UPI00293E29E4|nr:uncharacterized protein LOC132627040 [Lycium barbarum]XP_060198081.1 uncharacterized protein LOC132627040 [Lycium barbarum]XP_060198082.1 uncharacterized protein LOC132627040 [Lycium barbarum]
MCTRKRAFWMGKVLGLGAIPSRAFKQTRPRYSDLNASTYNNGSCSSQWQEKYNQMLNAHNKSQDNLNFLMNAHTEMRSTFKMYMIRKEGRIPEEFVGIFVSTTPPSTFEAIQRLENAVLIYWEVCLNCEFEILSLRTRLVIEDFVSGFCC